MSPGVGVAIYRVINKVPHILLMRRQNTHWDGIWALPGGWIDATDPTAEAAVLREIQEELGVVLSEEVAPKYLCTDTLKVSSYGEEILALTLYYQIWLPEHVRFDYINGEPNKCSAVQWWPVTLLPSEVAPGVTYAALAALSSN